MEEERMADEKLTEIAESAINIEEREGDEAGEEETETPEALPKGRTQ